MFSPKLVSTLGSLILTSIIFLLKAPPSQAFVTPRNHIRLNAVVVRKRERAVGLSNSFTKLDLIPTLLSPSSILVGDLGYDEHQRQIEILAFWISSFSLTHIGMSAIRQSLIEICGDAALSLKWVNTGMKLPSYWPGDAIGKREIFPDKDIAGRQIYRVGYTIVSFVTLGSALTTYLQLISGTGSEIGEWVGRGTMHDVHFTIASVSWGAAIASLVNPSPLSLMPGFTTSPNTSSIGSTTTITTNQSDNPPRAPPLGLQRADERKLEPRGLTRITRHPLILPVLPWGIATSALAGGRAADALFFGGLAIYAVAGCAAQDLRIVRREGSVGTVFRPFEDREEDVLPANSIGESDSSCNGTSSSLQSFYEMTSFVPFGAVLDGRQSLLDIWEESPWIALVVGSLIGSIVENALLDWIANYGMG